MLGESDGKADPSMPEGDWRGDKQEKQRLYWRVREERKQGLREKYERLKPHLGERDRRLWAANEALWFGAGGVRAVAEALQMSSMTILQGKRELQAEPSRAVAAMLVGVLAGVNPAGGTYPVATVVISGGGASDQSVESPEVKASVGWERPGQLRQARRANRQVVAKANCS
jgi:hypothetical protein